MDNEKILFDVPRLFVNIKHMEADEKKFVRSVHFHNEIEMVRVDKGRIICAIDDKRIPLQGGEIILINKRVVHKLSFLEESAKITYIQIDIDRYEYNFFASNNKIMRTFIKDGAEEYKVFSADSEPGKAFVGIEKELEEKELGYESYVASHIFSVIAYMYRNALMPDYSKLQNAELLNKLMPALVYAENNYNSKLSLGEAAEKVSMDKFYFCKLFKKAVGVSFTDYVNFLRMEKSIAMLLGSERSVSEIAYECGFSTLQYFNRLFKKQNGCTPREYRHIKNI